MNKTTLTLTAAALMACATGAASAGTMHSTQTFSAITNWTHTFTFPGFTPGPGQTLTKVEEILTETVAGVIKIDNTSGATADFTATLTNHAAKTLPARSGR